MLYNRCSPEGSFVLMMTEAVDYLQSNSSNLDIQQQQTWITYIRRTNAWAVIFEYVYILMFIFIYINIVCRKSLSIGKLQTLSPIYFEIRAFSPKLLSRIRHFRPRCFQDQAFSFKLLPRSGISFQVLPRSDIFIQVTSKIHTFLARSCKTRHFPPRSSKIPARIFHSLPRFWKWNLTDSCRKCMEVRLGHSLYGFVRTAHRTKIVGFWKS